MKNVGIIVQIMVQLMIKKFWKNQFCAARVTQ